MLTELDSPLSASLRARAAGAAGKLRIKEATSSLRRIALDEADDLTTRIAAVTSYLQLRGSATATDVKSLLCSRAWQLRATVYAHILNDPSEMTREIGEARFKRERNVKVRSYVSRRVKSVRSAESTQDDD